jgi:hypothetical protein
VESVEELFIPTDTTKCERSNILEIRHVQIGVIQMSEAIGGNDREMGQATFIVE